MLELSVEDWRQMCGEERGEIPGGGAASSNGQRTEKAWKAGTFHKFHGRGCWCRLGRWGVGLQCGVA